MKLAERSCSVLSIRIMKSYESKNTGGVCECIWTETKPLVSKVFLDVPASQNCLISLLGRRSPPSDTVIHRKPKIREKYPVNMFVDLCKRESVDVYAEKQRRR